MIGIQAFHRSELIDQDFTTRSPEMAAIDVRQEE